MTAQIVPLIRPRRQSYEDDVGYAARVEDRAQAIFYPALKEFLAKIDETALTTMSDIVRGDLAKLIDAISDYTPDKRMWGE